MATLESPAMTFPSDDLSYHFPDGDPFLGDDSSLQPDQSPSAILKGKLSFGDIMGACSQFAEAVKGHPEVNAFVGMMLKMTDLAKDNSTLEGLSLQHTLEAYLSSFAKNRRALFSQTREITSPPPGSKSQSTCPQHKASP